MEKKAEEKKAKSRVMHLRVNNSRKGKIEYLIIFRTKKSFYVEKNSTTKAKGKQKTM
jgi:hypothetical protein